jgi:hypothetical protein
MPLLPVPSPLVNPGAPLQRIVTNDLGGACQGLQIAGSWFRGSEFLYVLKVTFLCHHFVLPSPTK